MPTVGEFQDPFPYTPYAIQDDAVTRLRRFLASSVHGVVVLESPTGTGKSHMLLTSVLSDLFTLVRPSGQNRENAAQPLVATDEESSGCRRGAVDVVAVSNATPHSQAPSLASALQQRRLDEEITRLKEERKTRVRAARRQLRLAKKLLQRGTRAAAPELSAASRQALKRSRRDEAANVPGASVHADADDSDFLVEQNPLDVLRDTAASLGVNLFESASSSSSSTSSGSGSGSDSDAETDSELSLAQLATLVPLRKPKAYFASRTHTQIRQLLEDLRATEFAAYPVVPRAPRARDQPAAPRALRAIHVAGRQQLCINAAVRRAASCNDKVGSGTLSDLCLDAMQFEASPAGRAARRAANRAAAMRTYHVGSAAAPVAPGALGDMEDLAKTAQPRGCAYCAADKLRALLTHVQSESRSPAAAGTGVLSMDALKLLGEQLGACPYLAARLLARGADVVFVPYGYLVSDELRDGLLGGVATNAVSPAEQAGAAAAGATDGSVTNSSSELAGAATSISAMLHRRRRSQRAFAAAKAHRTYSTSGTSDHCSSGRHRPRHGDSADAGRGDGSKDGPDSVELAMAAESEPNFSGDVVALDEAHNLVDYCRSVSSVEINTVELCLVKHLFAAYVARYEARLLSKNKQRLREMVSFTQKLLTFACSPARGVAAATPSAWEFTAFLFAAQVDHVDVFPFLAFLVDSRLCVKLLGLVAFALRQESAEMARYRESTQQSNRIAVLNQTRKRRQQRVAAAAPLSAAAAATAVAGGGGGSASAENHPRRGGTAAAPNYGVAYGAAPSDDAVDLYGPLHHDPPPSSPPVCLFTDLYRRLLQPTAATATEGVDQAAAVAATTHALQRFEAVLRVFCMSGEEGSRLANNPAGADDDADRAGVPESGEDTTRVILSALRDTAPASTSSISSTVSSSSPPVAATAGAEAEWTMRFVQLEPGAYTLAPVLRQAKNVVLAGGTMQPLALSCGLLLPPSVAPASLALVSEPHVVPSSSFAVWALPCGPSGRRLDFSQRALAGADRCASGAPPPGSVAESAFAELAVALLNFSRVLPPAGAICFFTSYELERRFTAFLVQRGLYADIEEQKKIFREDDGGGGAESMLHAYRSWIYGEDGDGRATHGRRGALLFAVMGGRLSEGINFADDLCRAVLVVGLPYANLADTELRLFLQHVARTRVGKASRTEELATASLSDLSLPLSAAEWELYTDLCMRTVNQCIGRCLRHINDYAVVVLLDARYATRPDVQRKIASWMRPSFKTAAVFGECFRGVRDFFGARRDCHMDATGGDGWRLVPAGAEKGAGA